MSDQTGQPDAAAQQAATYTQELTAIRTELTSIDGRLNEIGDVLAEINAAIGGQPAPTPTPAPPAPTPTPTPTPTPAPTPPAPTPPKPTTVQAVYWMNQSQGDLHDAEAADIVTALNLQAAHLVELWPGLAPVAHVLWTGDPAKVPSAAWRMYWLPDADYAGALGYHDVDPHGQPYGRVFTRYKGIPWPALRPGGEGISISNVTSHEAMEIQADPGCQTTVKAPNGDVWALEDCDPVESYSYDVTLPDGQVVSLSDFVTAAFFDLPVNPGTPYDAMGDVKHPFTIAPGGYAIINDKQVFADNKPSLRYLSQQGSPVARSARRLGMIPPEQTGS